MSNYPADYSIEPPHDSACECAVCLADAEYQREQLQPAERSAFQRIADMCGFFDDGEEWYG